MTRWRGVRSLEQLGEERRQVVEELVRGRVAGREQEPVAARAGLGEERPCPEERLAGPLRRRPAPLVDMAGHGHPAHRPAVGMETRSQDGGQRIARRVEQALDLIALGELEVGQPAAPPETRPPVRRRASAARPSSRLRRDESE